MNWLQQILALLGSQSTDVGGTATPQIPGAGPAPDLTGSGTILGPSTAANQNATTAAQGQNAILGALGQTDFSKFSHPNQPVQPGQRPGLSTVPTFPDVQEQPSLQGLMAAIQARRQRLAQLGVGG